MSNQKTELTTTFAIHGSDGPSLVYETRCECERGAYGGDSNISNIFDAPQIIGAMAEAYVSINHDSGGVDLSRFGAGAFRQTDTRDEAAA